MVIHNLDVLSASIHPAEAHAELVINAYAVLARTIAPQGFQSVAWRNPQVFQLPRDLKGVVRFGFQTEGRIKGLLDQDAAGFARADE